MNTVNAATVFLRDVAFRKVFDSEDLKAGKQCEPAHLPDGFRVDLGDGVAAVPLQLRVHLELLLAGIGP